MGNIHPPFDQIDASDIWGVGNTVEVRVAGVGLKKYRYVKFLDAVTYAPGQVVTPTGTGWTAVTNDRSGGTTTFITRFGGVVIGTPTQNSWGWVQTFGYHAAVVTNQDDDIAAQDTIIVDTNEDGQVDSVATATLTGDLSIVGTADTVDVDASDTVAVWINPTYPA